MCQLLLVNKFDKFNESLANCGMKEEKRKGSWERGWKLEMNRN